MTHTAIELWLAAQRRARPTTLRRTRPGDTPRRAEDASIWEFSARDASTEHPIPVTIEFHRQA